MQGPEDFNSKTQEQSVNYWGEKQTGEKISLPTPDATKKHWGRNV
jgi:hypothetical protein